MHRSGCRIIYSWMSWPSLARVHVLMKGLGGALSARQTAFLQHVFKKGLLHKSPHKMNRDLNRYFQRGWQWQNGSSFKSVWMCLPHTGQPLQGFTASATHSKPFNGAMDQTLQLRSDRAEERTNTPQRHLRLNHNYKYQRNGTHLCVFLLTHPSCYDPNWSQFLILLKWWWQGKKSSDQSKHIIVVSWNQWKLQQSLFYIF